MSLCLFGLRQIIVVSIGWKRVSTADECWVRQEFVLWAVAEQHCGRRWCDRSKLFEKKPLLAIQNPINALILDRYQCERGVDTKVPSSHLTVSTLLPFHLKVNMCVPTHLARALPTISSLAFVLSSWLGSAKETHVGFSEQEHAGKDKKGWRKILETARYVGRVFSAATKLYKPWKTLP